MPPVAASVLSSFEIPLLDRQFLESLCLVLFLRVLVVLDVRGLLFRSNDRPLPLPAGYRWMGRFSGFGIEMIVFASGGSWPVHVHYDGFMQWRENLEPSVFQNIIHDVVSMMYVLWGRVS